MTRRSLEQAWAHAIPAFFDLETLIDLFRLMSSIRHEKNFPEKFSDPLISLPDSSNLIITRVYMSHL